MNAAKGLMGRSKFLLHQEIMPIIQKEACLNSTEV